MNISQPNPDSEVYKQFLILINQKVSQAVMWLGYKHIDYVWNNRINNHLYRLYIPKKDLLLDFEYYPMNNVEYNYIRVNFDTDVIQLLEHLFPTTVIDTNELDVWKLHQKATNHFLRENRASPVYDSNVLRLALVKNNVIYQCIVVKGNRIIRNVTKRDCSVPYGTYILLRYLNEMFGVSEVLITESTENSYMNTLYQILNLPIVVQTNKKKIWWNPDGCKWKIKKEQTSQFVPFYYCETVVYRYPE